MAEYELILVGMTSNCSFYSCVTVRFKTMVFFFSKSSFIIAIKREYKEKYITTDFILETR
jgi:hypothetical protein